MVITDRVNFSVLLNGVSKEHYSAAGNHEDIPDLKVIRNKLCHIIRDPYFLHTRPRSPAAALNSATAFL